MNLPKNVTDWICEASLDELREVNRCVVERIKAVRAVSDAQALLTFKPGQEVKVQFKKGWLPGVVKKIGRTRVDVEVTPLFGPKKVYRCPPGLVKGV